MNDKRIEEKLDTHYELLLELRTKMDEMLTRNEFHSTLQNYPTRKEMDDRINKIENLAVSNANKLTELSDKLDKPTDDPD